MRYVVILLAAALCLPHPAQAQTLDRIRETKEIRLGFRTDAPPLSYADAQGRPAGYTPTLCAAVVQTIANGLKAEDLQATFYPVDATNRFDKVANGEIDLLCGAATITMRRRMQVDFSDPVFIDGISFIARTEAEYPSMSAFGGRKVGVRAGTTTEEAVANSFKAAGVEAEISTFADHNDGIGAVERGEIDAYFADQAILFGLHRESAAKDGLKVWPEILTVEKQGLVMRRGDSEFRGLVDTALSLLYSSGEIERIFADTLPGANPGLALRAMFLIAPTLP